MGLLRPSLRTEDRGSECERKGSKDERSVKWAGSAKKNSLKGRLMYRGPAEEEYGLSSGQDDVLDRAEVQVELSGIYGVKKAV